LSRIEALATIHIEKVDIETRILSWDCTFCYIEHRFWVADQLHAKTLARVVFIRGQRIRAFYKLLIELNDRTAIESPAKPEQITAWLQLLETQKI
jgi:hypothetical protein